MSEDKSLSQVISDMSLCTRDLDGIFWIIPLEQDIHCLLEKLNESLLDLSFAPDAEQNTSPRFFDVFLQRRTNGFPEYSA